MSRFRLRLLGVSAAVVLVALALWSTTAAPTRSTQPERRAVDAHNTPSTADARPSPGRGGVASRPVDPPNPRSEGGSPYSAAFEEQLLRAATANGQATPEEACMEWGRIIPLALSDGASRAEFEVGLSNVADACTRPAGSRRSDHDLRLAHEALRRYSEVEPRADAQLQAFVEHYPAVSRTRSNLLFVAAHPAGTAVVLDGQRACLEPCMLAVPVDGQAHRMAFSGPAGAAEFVWTPPSLDAEPAPLPALR